MIIKIDTDRLRNLDRFIHDMQSGEISDTLYQWKSTITDAMLQAQADTHQRTVCAIGSKEWMDKINAPPAPEVTTFDGLYKPTHRLGTKPGFNGEHES